MRHLLISYHTDPYEEPGTDLAGGMNVFLRGLLDHLEGQTVVLTRGTGDRSAVFQPRPGVTVHALACGYEKPWTREKAWERLPDFVAAAAAFRDFDVASVHYWMSGVAALRLGYERPVTMFHTIQATKKVDPAGGLAPARDAAERELARRSHRVVFLTALDARVTRGLLGPMPHAVIPPGLTGDFRPSERKRSGKRLVVAAGRNDPVKKMDMVRAAVAELADTHELLVVGDPPLPHSEMPSLFARADVVLCPSDYETFGLVTLEALACGASVVVSPGGYWERVFRRTGCGLAADDLARALRRLAADPEGEREMRRRAVKVASRFTWPRSAARWRALLDDAAR